MKRELLGVLLAVTTALPAGVLAQTTTSGPAAAGNGDQGSKSQIVPDLPKGDKGQQVVISHGQNKTFYEYRVNGVLKQIKVVPSHGPAYYLVPANGGGWIREDKSQLLIPSWVLFRW